MAVFRAQLFYEIPALGKWTNVYHVDAEALLDARIGIQTDMIPTLLTILNSAGTLHKLLVSDPLSTDFSEVSIEAAGEYVDSGSLLPLWNSVKVLFQPSDLGRPDLKYVKGIIGENNQTNGILEALFTTAIDVAFTTILGDMTTAGVPLCSENGSLWGNVAVQPAVQMRQLHRRRRRTVAP